MNHYHVCVYAICKNEAKFVPGWIESMREADSIVVLDTGSTDETVRLLEEGGAKVTREIISPWRFDTARNRSLELVPEEADICVCTDLDELLRPGWRALLEAAWKPGTGQATYRYVWNFNEDGSEGVVFWYEKVHARGLYRWIHPVHEVLEYIGEGPRPETVRVEGMQLDHHADPAKSRSQYLPLLELSVRENPGDDRGLHYLGREYLFQRRWDDAIGALTRHLALPSATWEDERCASMRFLAQACRGKGDLQQARRWLLRAAGEAPWLREPWVELAEFFWELQEYDATVWAARQALSISKRPESYICTAEAWGALPWDLLSLGLWYTGRTAEAREACRRALAIAPGEDRLQKNLRLMEETPK